MSSTNFQRILFVCTSSTGGEGTGDRSGLWLEELTVPYFTFVDAGFKDIEIVSIKGGEPVIDEACHLPQNNSKSIDKFHENDDSIQSKFKAAKSLRSFLQDEGALAGVGCVFLCGGHGCIGDFPENKDIEDVVEYVYNVTKGCVAAICHGQLGLVTCRQFAFKANHADMDPATDSVDCITRAHRSSGKLLLEGKFVSAFSNEEERALGLYGKLPVLTESLVDAAGAICVPGPPWKPNAVVDGKLVTGQNPQSALEVARRVLDVMRSLGDKFSPAGNANKPWGK